MHDILFHMVFYARFATSNVVSMYAVCRWVATHIHAEIFRRADILGTAISHMLAGILHVQICCSHFSMDTYEGALMREKLDVGEDIDYFRHQLASSLNIDSNWLTHWFHGGLQFQIEHHLFPRIPRHNLKHVKVCRPCFVRLACF